MTNPTDTIASHIVAAAVAQLAWQREQVANRLRRGGPLTVAQLAQGLVWPVDSVEAVVRGMVEAGALRRSTTHSYSSVP